MTAPDFLQKAIQPNGDLDATSLYLCWFKGDKTATLDGEFTADELRAIADYMDANSLTPPQG